ncbi:hypothetical protein QBC38DRAFT_52011 [Podospora fimiseda]|uniref:Rhodopsin domain-containing protein n=1 Tax=Podospora fimiseda TaxID=252190 RepID=A0AAN7GX71_9PEZI|nr:hypothetical protein QBC38DRAFT_52011 [Podospora fimiseda]
MSAPPPFEEPYPGWAEENKGPTIMGVTIAMTILTTMFVAARLYSRMISMGRLFIDDYIVIFCIVLCFAYLGLAGAAIAYGGGRHVQTLSPGDVQNALFFIIISFVPGVSGFVIPKFAVVILLAKLLNPGRTHRMIMWVISVLYFLMMIGMLVINFAQCTPAATQWGGADGVCWDRKITVDYSMALGIVSVFFDFYLAIYPTVVLLQLQLHWQKKLALASSLGFGYCAGAITCYKCYTLSGLLEIKDFTYTVDDVIVWTNIEACCVLIGACIPTLYPMMKKIFGNSVLGGTSRRTASKGTPGSGYKMSGRSGRSGSGANGTVVTIGSRPKKGRSRTGSHHLNTNLDTINDIDADGKYVILEERSFHYSTTELAEHDAVAASAAHARKEAERATQQPGW